MSNLRERAREIKAAGEAERGNFEPHGVPLRLYNYWLDISPSEKAKDIAAGRRRENFCHFWRVVLIWAPLIWFGENVLATKAFAVAVGAALLGGLVYVVVSTGTVLPVLIGLGVAIGVIALLAGAFILVDKYWNHDWDKAFQKVVAVIAALVGIALVVALLVLAIQDAGWIVLAYIAGGLVALVAFVFGVGTLAEFISGRRSLAREKARNARYEYYDEHGHYPEDVVEPREPGALAKFFSGVADFLILATQIVRVKKWKICPMVTIEQ